MTVNDRWTLSGCGVLQTNYPGGPSCAWIHVKVVDDGQKNGICFLRGLAVIGSMLWHFLLSPRFSRWLLFSRMIGWFWLPIVCDSDYALSASLLCMMSRPVFAFRWMSTQPIVGSSSGASGLTNSPLGCKMNRSSLALQCNPYVYSSG